MDLVLVCTDCGEAFNWIGDAADHEGGCAVKDNIIGKYLIEATGD